MLVLLGPCLLFFVVEQHALVNWMSAGTISSAANQGMPTTTGVRPPPPPAPPPPPPPPARAAAPGGADGGVSPQLVAVDLGRGKQVSVMLPPQAQEPSEAELRRLETSAGAEAQQGVLGACTQLITMTWP